MNTIREIIANKPRRTIKEESIYETYKRELCTQCKNKYNNKDLCEIRVNIKNEAQCVNYERCMKRKCQNCKRFDNCFGYRGVKNESSSKFNRRTEKINRKV